MNLLFAPEVFPDVKADRRDNDDALDNLLPVRVDADEGESVVDDAEDQHADDHARHGADAAGVGDAAHDAGGDRVELIVEAVGGGRAARPRALEETREPVEQSGDGLPS